MHTPSMSLVLLGKTWGTLSGHYGASNVATCSPQRLVSGWENGTGGDINSLSPYTMVPNQNKPKHTWKLNAQNKTGNVYLMMQIQTKTQGEPNMCLLNSGNDGQRRHNRMMKQLFNR